jgi:DNA mismatch endonuclease (patch repair protein)
MSDVVSKEKRSEMMSGIRGKNTRPEIILRKALFAHGFRYRINDKNLPGKPDIVFPKYHVVIQVHGCFWHGHDCHLFKWPSTRQDFWRQKIESNRKNDRIKSKLLIDGGWRILTVWECAFKGSGRFDFNMLVNKVALWIVSGKRTDEIKGYTLD